MEEIVRAQIAEVTALAEADPLGAVAKAEALARTLKGVKPWDADLAKAIAALKKDPRVTAALRQKQAEDQGAAFLDRAAALEAKGDLTKALEWCKKAAALVWSRQDEAKAKVAELEAKVGGK